MDELKKKYWKGTSEVNEEQALKKHAGKNEQRQFEDEYFAYLEYKKEETLNDPDFDRNLLDRISDKQGTERSLFQKINWRIAAAILVLITAGVLFMRRQTETKDIISSTDTVVMEDTFEDPLLAYEETKKALLLISSNLNKGNTYTTKFVKFSQSQENLKKNN
jgi:hypothetical protein